MRGSFHAPHSLVGGLGDETHLSTMIVRSLYSGETVAILLFGPW